MISKEKQPEMIIKNLQNIYSVFQTLLQLLQLELLIWNLDIKEIDYNLSIKIYMNNYSSYNIYITLQFRGLLFILFIDQRYYSFSCTIILDYSLKYTQKSRMQCVCRVSDPKSVFILKKKNWKNRKITSSMYQLEHFFYEKSFLLQNSCSTAST